MAYGGSSRNTEWMRRKDLEAGEVEVGVVADGDEEGGGVVDGFPGVPMDTIPHTIMITHGGGLFGHGVTIQPMEIITTTKL